MKIMAGTGTLWALLILVLASGCASRQVTEPTGANDPFQPVNRAIYKFNDIGDRYLLRPVAVGYEHGLPPQIRRGIQNIFTNLIYPVTIANAFLQGKFRQTGHDGARFLLNSTVGLAGLFDPASRVGLPEHDEDFGQTLGVWGVPEGPYLVVPLLGPRTTRHAVGTVVDAPLTPFIGISDGQLNLTLGLWVIYAVDKRSRLLDVDHAIFEAFDPYLFVRDAYLQNRRYQVLDGNLPDDDSYLDDFEDYYDPDESNNP
ncbi:MAG: VacJ family lipoprotein [Gammaproteobacteria bacterium]